MESGNNKGAVLSTFLNIAAGEALIEIAPATPAAQRDGSHLLISSMRARRKLR